MLFDSTRRLFFLGVLVLIPAGLYGQQCTLPSNIFLPAADEVKHDLFGMSIDVDGDYMVAGMQDNSSQQVYSGKALVYKIDADNRWEQIAELVPSDPAKYLKFGSKVSIRGNSIVVRGREYNDDGIGREKLYVFEKAQGDEWTSTAESYVITKPFGSPLGQGWYSTFALRNNELVVASQYEGKGSIEIYTKSGGIFSLSQEIDAPASDGGYVIHEWNLALGDDFIVMANEQIQNADGSNGAVFIYEKNGLYNPTPVVLKSSLQTPSQWEGFGIAAAVSNNTVFIQGLKQVDNSYNRTFYIFEKPPGGWVDAVQPITLEWPGYIYSYAQLVANDDYFFSTDQDYASIVGFKKPAGGWSSAATPFTISDNSIAGKSVFGYQLELNANHLVVGCPNRFMFTGIGEDLIVDYYSSTGAWEDEGQIPDQIIREISINATDDFFGDAFSVYNDQLAVTASGDDELGYDAGVVYIFDAQAQGTVPKQKLFNPEDENYTGFGVSIAVGDSVMFIGAPFKDSVGVDGKAIYYNIGKVYVYRLTPGGWIYSSQIIAPDIHSEVTFGQQLACSPGYCSVTEFYGGSSESIGRVHIYKENEVNGKFEYIATLDPETHLRSDFFGRSIVMTDSLMVIGTGFGVVDASYRMSAYVFKKKGEWESTTEDARLVATDAGWADRFAASVSMYGDYIVVGAPYSPGFDPRPIPRSYIIPGAAYIYKRPSGGWKGTLTELAKLSPSDPTELGRFGASVAIDHDDIFIGSPSVADRYNYTDHLTNHDNTLIPGKVYHFKKPAGEWITTSEEIRQLQSFEPEIVDGYGSHMYVSDRYLYVGVPLDDTPSGFRSGSVQTMMQLPVIDAPPIVCIDQVAIRLFGFPKGGIWSGSGVNASTGIFNPAIAGAGIHTIIYQRSGCEASVQIGVLPNQMTVLNQSDLNQTKCVSTGIPVRFETTESADHYMWYFRKAANEPSLKIDSLKQVIVAVNPGQYEVVVNRGACRARKQVFNVMDEDSVHIKINSVPPLCSPTAVQLEAFPLTGTWIGPGISVDGRFNPGSLPNGNYKQLYQVTTDLGCNWTDSVTVEVDILKQPWIQYNGEPICGDDMTVSLSLINVDERSTIIWFNDGRLLEGKTELTIEVAEAGNFSATVSKKACELSTPVQPVPKEVIDIHFDIPVVCSDEPVMLNVTPSGGTWLGQGIATGGGIFDSRGLSDGDYPTVYSLVTTLGCVWQKTTTIKIDRLKDPTLTSTLEEVCVNQPATLKLDNVDDRTTIRWYDSFGNEITDRTGRTLSIGTAGSYYASVTKSYCNFQTAAVTLNALIDSLYVPNVFTANNDGVNEYFEIRSKGIDQFHLWLFNRHGKVLFESQDPSFTWSPDNVPAGVYYWNIKYTTCSDIPKNAKGWVQIIK